MAIYGEMVRAGVPIEHHDSDLYVPVNAKTREIVQQFKRAGLSGVTTFKSGSELWYDIPFAYEPFFHRR